jgi:hypothetical protein
MKNLSLLICGLSMGRPQSRLLKTAKHLGGKPVLGWEVRKNDVKRRKEDRGWQ